MSKSLVKENNFEPAPGGSAGAVNYGIPYGTPSGGNTVQNPNHFSSDTKSTSHIKNMDEKPETDKDDEEIEKDVEQLFTKKQTPSPDELMSALQYELGKMVKKDKHLAKQIVIKNWKSDPTHYSRLGMLNIDDDKMKVDESKPMTLQEQFDKQDQNLAATKDIIEQMIAERQGATKREVRPELVDIMKTMWADKREKLYGRREEVEKQAS